MSSFCAMTCNKVIYMHVHIQIDEIHIYLESVGYQSDAGIIWGSARVNTDLYDPG